MAAAAQSTGEKPGRGLSLRPPPPSGGREAEVGEVAEMLSKLNPAAEEFVPAARRPGGRLSADAPDFVLSADYLARLSDGGNGYDYNFSKDSSSDGSGSNESQRKKKNGYYGRWRVNQKLRNAQKENIIKRTVYVSDVDQHVTEEELARLFAACGHVNDCRICGDPHSFRRFAFIEFGDERGARVALGLGGAMLGYYAVKVLPSKTAILPVNPKFLPQSEDEKDMCTRTVYCTSIDKELTETDVKGFFESACGKVSRLRLLGDSVYSTRIAFVEFVVAESALAALNCSGMMLGTLRIRVSPSKTPVRPSSP